ncbi:MAG: sugar kinase [Candidatus Bipolaricaulota bacterium]|nr:sugar kinase [Candidatus Bipolaricaulota bacterium]
MAALVTFGEALIRLSPPGFQRLEQASSLDLHVGGAELNAAVTAHRLGLSARYITRLPRNPLGHLIAHRVQGQGVDTAHIVWTDTGRVGLYFVEFGASPRASSVVYDRRGSAMAEIRPGEVDWESAMRGARAFHTTGITPALSPSAASATAEAVQTAKALGLVVSIDLNYRARLWSPEEARRVMAPLVAQADLLLTTEEDAERVFGIRDPDLGRVAERLAKEFGSKVVAVTIRETPSVWRNTWSALAYTQGEVVRGPVFDLEIVDRVGAGDAFAGGFLYGFLQGTVGDGLRYGLAASALKHTIPGDLLWATKDEVEQVLRGGGLRIVR